ncbi:MAG: tetratricopeptide repeat protein [Wenzhouxiangella sp.]
MPDPRLKQAIERHQAGYLPEAETLYRAILTDDPDHPEVHARLGDIALRTGHFEDAARLFHQALQQQPEQPEIWKQLIEALVKAGYSDDAAKVIEEGRRLGLIAVDPDKLPAGRP